MRYDLIDCVRPANSNMARESIQERQFFFLSGPGLVSPFFCDELLASVLHFVSVDRGRSKGSAGRGLYHERGVNLFQIYNMDFGNVVVLSCQ